jgi:threonine aldolase
MSHWHSQGQNKEKGIAISSMGQGKLRIVTHLDYREVMHSYVLETLKKL